MNAGYAVYDVHDQGYKGTFVATIAGPYGAIRISCDDTKVIEDTVAFVRVVNDTNVVVAMIPTGMPYFVILSSLMHPVSQDDIFEEQLDMLSRQKIYQQRAERLHGKNDGPDAPPRSPFD